ncbi:MAG: asparagine synthase (glutamine-hydrolyzing) [Lentisphaerae bacterium]|nr:asparagine synthase (glutamine-hydrolyzing) [Lentisphaerota bacterium]
MCGIAGFNWKDEALIARMTDVMAHRGPDQSGFYCDDAVSLGHRRLSIIDLSDNARQPMRNEDASLQLIFNGEIYNFAELRDSLLKKNHRFLSRSDSEVILHAYEEYGRDCLRHLRGMFAFALWDRRRQALFLARDRIGIKPLYYYFHAGRLIFASEIKAILRHPDVQRELNHQALYDYIGFEFVGAPDTMFRNIFKIPAGHTLWFQNGVPEVRPYWELSFAPHPGDITRQDAEERELELLDHAVKSHLVSDVPLGVFLSGGLDSSALVAMMRRHITGPLRTFTIGYPDKSYSELDYAKIVSDRFGTEHHVLMIESVSQDTIEKALWHLDEPMTDLSTVPLYLICQKAREQVTVCLSGEGGDESFAGYDRFKASKANRWYRLIPRPLRRHIITPLLDRFPDQIQKKGLINILKRFAQGSDLPEDGQHLRWQYFSNPALDQALYRPGFKGHIAMDPFHRVRDYAALCDARDRINREIFLDMRFIMTESVLMKVDKMSMAHSLEVRVPLLDHVYVEFIASLPGHWKLKGYRTKDILRSCLKGLLPDTIVNRGKQGYSLPIKNLLRDQLKDYMIQLLNDSPVIRENLESATVNRLIREHLSMTHNHNHVLWALINVANWHRNVFCG